ncbi:MAG TPA: hypothetical protein VFW20_03150 [Candidatus Limnocylindrales bacterium]|nr:hypothetical protein [Candidatus Limnocylindrales bacterium]
MTGAVIRVQLERTRQRSFATAVDWPGWSRSGKTPELALAALAAYEPRYRAVATVAGLPLPAGPLDFEVIETHEGDAGTSYGVPSRLAAVDSEPTTAPDARRLAALVVAAWSTLDRIAASAPEALTKGPRGGGRDTSKIVAHVRRAEAGYAPQLGVKAKLPDEPSAEEVAPLRRELLDVLERPSDGQPIAKRWTARYAARRIAWHALDHAWEIEDRTPR